MAMTRSDAKSSSPTKQGVASRWQVIEMAAGIVLCSAIGGILLTGRFPAIRPFVTWTLRIYAAMFVTMIVLVVVFSIVRGATETVKLYKSAMASSGTGPRMRAVWALVFGIGFLIAAVIARY